MIIKILPGLFALLALVASAHATQKVDLVLVKKSERKLILMSNGEALKTYRISLGPRPQGHKQFSGDERTPEGRYLLDYKRESSRFYKAFHISYPNETDLAVARRRGVNPGGNILLHGYPEDGSEPEEIAGIYNWTNGCIAVPNAAMDEIFAEVEPGTPIDIQP